VPFSGLSEGGATEGQGPVESKYRRYSPSAAGPAQVLGSESSVQNGGKRVQQPSESDKTVPCSARIILECSCGEQLILLGLEEDWRSEQRMYFECSCGKGLTLSNRLNEEVLAFRQLIRGARGIHRD
jgi:hypothetical protein